MDNWFTKQLKYGHFATFPINSAFALNFGLVNNSVEISLLEIMYEQQTIPNFRVYETKALCLLQFMLSIVCLHNMKNKT